MENLSEDETKKVEMLESFDFFKRDHHHVLQYFWDGRPNSRCYRFRSHCYAKLSTTCLCVCTTGTSPTGLSHALVVVVFSLSFVVGSDSEEESCTPNASHMYANLRVFTVDPGRRSNLKSMCLQTKQRTRARKRVRKSSRVGG